MPISSGAKGRPGVLAIPGQVSARGSSGPARWSSAPRRESALGEGGKFTGATSKKFRSKNFSTVNPRITGITKDLTSAVLGSVTVQLFRTVDDFYLGEVVSDASTGVYFIDAPGPGPFYLVAYKAGAPDVAGTTVNSLVATL